MNKVTPYLNDAFYFFAKKFGIKSTVVFTFEKFDNPLLNGYCYPLSDDMYMIKLASDRFSLSQISTFFHELVHVHQMERKSLSLTDDGVIWHNQFYTNDDVIEAKNNDQVYRKLPWEQEAFGKQEELFDEFVRQLPYKKLTALNELSKSDSND